MGIALKIPFVVQHHRAWVVRGPNGNVAETKDHLVEMFTYASKASVPIHALAVYQGTNAFRVVVGVPKTPFVNLYVPNDSAISGTPGMMTNYRLDQGQISPDGVGANNDKNTLTTQQLAKLVPSVVPTTLLKRIDSYEYIMSPEELIEARKENPNVSSSIHLDVGLIAGKAMIAAQREFARMNQALKKSEIYTKTVGAWVMACSDVSASPSFAGEITLIWYPKSNTVIAGEIDFTDADWQRDVEQINTQLYIQSKLFLDGHLKDTEIVVPTRPLSTMKDSVRDKLDQWWTDVMLAYRNLQAQVIASSAGRIAADTAATVPKFLETQTKALPPVEPGTAGWKTTLAAITDKLGEGASKVWQTITDWGPRELAMGYAGYTAVESAKSSSIPPWMILGGIGLAAVALK